jgi:hypothetical protein
MDFDWNNLPFNLPPAINLQEIEESFEDPFAQRLLPDSPRFSAQARFFNLGVSSRGLGIFSVYRTNGRQVRVIFARPFEPEDQFFYEKRLNQALAS